MGVPGSGRTDCSRKLGWRCILRVPFRLDDTRRLEQKAKIDSKNRPTIKGQKMISTLKSRCRSSRFPTLGYGCQLMMRFTRAIAQRKYFASANPNPLEGKYSEHHFQAFATMMKHGPGEAEGIFKDGSGRMKLHRVGVTLFKSPRISAHTDTRQCIEKSSLRQLSLTITRGVESSPKPTWNYKLPKKRFPETNL